MCEIYFRTYFIYMKKKVQQYINRKPLMALAIILFGAGIAYYTNAAGREGLDTMDATMPATTTTATTTTDPATTSATSAMPTATGTPPVSPDALVTALKNGGGAAAIAALLTPEQKKKMGLA
jgi:predicted membrane-bound mannosyltransferase